MNMMVSSRPVSVTYPLYPILNTANVNNTVYSHWGPERE